MNIDTINTPSDLVEANKEVSPAEKAVAALEECNYQETKSLISWLLGNCVSFHQTEAVKALNSETPADAIQWIEDVANFNTAKKIIDEIS